MEDNDKIIAELKAEIETLKKVKHFACINLNNYIADNNKLKAENDRLKQEWRLDCLKCEYKNTKADVDKYRKTLQEIREIAVDTKDCKQYEIDHDCFNDTRCKALREFIETLQEILDLITKAEEE